MPRWLPPHHLPRPRLAERLAEAPLAIVEAGSGYGKSTLAFETAAALALPLALVALDRRAADAALLPLLLARALRRSGLSDLAGSMETGIEADDAVEALADALAARPDPVVIAFDDIHHLDDAGFDLLVRLARDVRPPHRLWVLTRRLEPARRSRLQTPSAIRLEAADLAFTRAEAEALCIAVVGEDGPAEALLRTTGGWVSALVLGTLAAARRDGGAHGLRGDASAAMAELVRCALDELDPADRDALVALARVPRLSPEVAAAATGRAGLLERASGAGLPFAPVPAGWWELPGPVVDLLTSLAPPDPGVARGAAEALVRAGEPGAAIDTLLAAGEDAAAAGVLVSLPPQALERLDDLEIQATVTGLSESAVREHPRVLVHLARACESGAHIDRRTATLERAEGLAEELADPALRREIAAERARDLVRDGAAEAAARTARELLAEAGPAEIQTRARAALVLGTALVRHGAPSAEAEPCLEEAHRLALAAGRKEWAVSAWMLLAVGVYARSGQAAEAAARMDEALALLPARSSQRAVMLSIRAEQLNELGRYDEARASLLEARRLAEELRLPRAHAYAVWEEARTASQTGDAAATLALLREADERRGEWYEKETGAIFLADAADLLDRVGSSEARAFLERARERRHDSPFSVALAEAVVEARSGDPDEAERLLLAAQDHPQCPPRERWRLTLMRAHAARRLGDPAASSLAAQAMREAAAIGNPDLPLIRERVIAESLLALRDVEDEIETGPDRLAARITALGSFRVLRGSRELRLPPGAPEQLVQLLVASGGSAHAEVVIETLWPEVAPESGRKRLRNALFRLRSAAGDVVGRDGEILVLVAGTEVDAVGFEADARRALAEAHPDARAALARSAASRYAGDLLPHNRYDDWAISARERLRGRYLALLDLLIADAEARRDVDEAIRLLARATDADPADDRRHVQAARLLLAQGRRGAAETVVRRAETVLDELGLPITSALRALRSEIAA